MPAFTFCYEWQRPKSTAQSVELKHRDLPADEQPGHASGWTHYLARLQTTAGQHPVQTRHATTAAAVHDGWNSKPSATASERSSLPLLAPASPQSSSFVNSLKAGPESANAPAAAAKQVAP